MNWWFSEVGHLVKCKLMIFRDWPPYLSTIWRWFLEVYPHLCIMSWWFPQLGDFLKYKLIISSGGPPLSFYYELMMGHLLRCNLMILVSPLTFLRSVNLVNFSINLPLEGPTSEDNYRTRAIISRGLYFFLLIFHWGCGLYYRPFM